jgi:predicted acetyltransferase
MVHLAMTHRRATLADVPLLAGLNHQLIRDEGHRNPMTVPELAERMSAWLSSGEYTAVLFEADDEVVAYALYAEQLTEVYLRHLFVVRHRRRHGFGRQAMSMLQFSIWPRDKRLTVQVLCTNAPALAFYRTLGYADYCLSLEMMPKS